MIVKKIEEKYFKWFFLILLILIIGLITYFRVNTQLYLGPTFDVYDLLANAALFAGKGIGFSDLLRPPLIPFLTSIYFMFGELNVGVIFVVDGVLYLVGCIGLYLFLNERFKPIISFVGSLLFATFPVVLTNACVGYNDVSSVSIGIWAIYLTYLSVKRNSKFFYLAFPVAMLAFLTRYNMALLIFPMLVFILMGKKDIKNPKDVVFGILLGMLVLVPVFNFFNAELGNPIYPFMEFLATSEGSGVTEHFAYNPDSLYFVKYLPYYLGTASFLIIFLAFFGVLFNLYKKMDKIRVLTCNKLIRNAPKTDGIKIRLTLLLGLSTFFIITFGKVNYLVSEILFFGVIYLINDIFNEWGWNYDIDLLYLSWFTTFFIFQSVYVAKDHRYFITMAPAVAYFLLRGLKFSTEKLKLEFNKKNLTLYILSAFLVLLMISSTVSQLSGIEEVNINNKLFNEDVSNACQWLKGYDPDYKSKHISADLWSYFAWYLQMDVVKMPIFRNNQRLYQGTKDHNFTKEDKLAFDHELNTTNPDYYFGIWKGMNFTNYKPIQNFGSVTIYKKME